MRGFLLAALCSTAYALTVWAIFAASLPERRAALMVRIYVFFVPVLAGAVLLAPADLGFLPAQLVEPNAWLDASFALFAFSASVFGGWLQLYNLADRGLSLRILIDASEAPDGAVSPLSLETGYGKGRGMRWMYDKRLSDMEKLGLVLRQGDELLITEKGRSQSRLIFWLRRLYAIPAVQAIRS